MKKSLDKKSPITANTSDLIDMRSVIGNISDLIIYNKKIKNNETIPADLARRILEINTQAAIEYALSSDFEKEIIIPNENIIIKTYQRFVQYDYSQPYTSESLVKLKNNNYPIDFSYLIRTTYQYMLNLDLSEIERKLQYYEKAYFFITTFVQQHYKLKSQELFVHYQRAALSTYIVIELKLVTPPKALPDGGYTNADLVEISKNALKPIMKRF